MKLSAALLITFFSTSVFAIPDDIDFRVLDEIPQPAVGAFGVVGTAVADGRFLLWDGDSVYLQRFPGADQFDVIGTGYLGDPAFITLNPGGDSALLGQGFGDGTNANVYVIDLANPVDFTGGDEIVVQSHFSGVFLTSTLVAFDRGDFGFPAEIIVLDLGLARSSRSHPMTVLSLPEPPADRTNVVTKPGGSFSASLAVNAGLLYVADSGNGQYKSFAVADIINAFNTTTPIAWASGTDIGAAFQYPLGGVSGFTAGGNLVMAGFGSIVEVNPASGAIVKTLDPAGTGPFYGIIYNSTNEDLIAVEFPALFGDPLIYHGTAQGFPAMPAQSYVGLWLLLAALAMFGLYATRPRIRKVRH